MKRLFSVILAFLLLWIGTAAGEKASGLIPRIMEEQTALAGQTGLQGWVDTALTETADGTGGWYLIALRRLEKMEADGERTKTVSGTAFSGARKALEDRAAQETGSITRRERMALTLQALSSSSDFIRQTAEAAEQEDTLMPLVFALHLMNNDPGTFGTQRPEIADRLIDLQLADGGWAVIGEACDVDCTAMTLQALSPLQSKPEVKEAVARGVEALSRVQQENGGFLGMGQESAESCAQVLLALSCLGIDAAEDERFLKEGGSVIDAMLRFRIEGDGFAHDLKSGRRNDTATVQCFYALVGYESMRQGGGPYYVFDFAPPAEAPAFQPGKIPLKGWLCAGAAGLVILGWILAAVRKKRNWRSYLFPLLAGLALTGLILAVEIQTPEGFYGGAGSAAKNRNQETTISIRCDSIAGENEYAPADGVLLEKRTVLIAEGETAFDQLMEATRQARIQMEYDGTTAGVYVRGIGYLYEYAFGNLSGWMYKVNGEYADVGCSQYQLRAGDQVEWVYTRNLGRDEE